MGEEGDTRSGSHASTPAQPNRLRVRKEVGEGVGGQQRRKSAKCPHNPRESKCGKYRDTSVKRKAATQPLGHMTRCLCVHTHASTHKQAHGATVNMYAYFKEPRSANTFAGSVVKSLLKRLRYLLGRRETHGQPHTRRHPHSQTACAYATARGGRGCGRATKKKESKCPHNPRESKCGKYRDTSVKRKAATQPLGHMTRCLCVHTQASAWSYCEKYSCREARARSTKGKKCATKKVCKVPAPPQEKAKVENTGEHM